MIDLIPHPSIVIAAELRTLLAGLTLPESIGSVTFSHVAVPELELIDLQAGTQVLIAGRGLESEASSRSSTTETPEVDVCVRTNCKPSDLMRFHLFMSFAWALGREVLAQRKVADFKALKVTSAPIYNVDRLRSENELLINQTIQFRAILEHS